MNNIIKKLFIYKSKISFLKIYGNIAILHFPFFFKDFYKDTLDCNKNENISKNMELFCITAIFSTYISLFWLPYDFKNFYKFDDSYRKSQFRRFI